MGMSNKRNKKRQVEKNKHDPEKKANNGEILLHIELVEEIKEIVQEYCTASGNDPHSIAYAMGYLEGVSNNNEVAFNQIAFLLQQYFFAGVFYANEFEFAYKYLTEKERNKRRELLEKQVRDKQQQQDTKSFYDLLDKKKKPKMDYVG